MLTLAVHQAPGDREGDGDGLGEVDDGVGDGDGVGVGVGDGDRVGVGEGDGEGDGFPACSIEVLAQLVRAWTCTWLLGAAGQWRRPAGSAGPDQGRRSAPGLANLLVTHAGEPATGYRWGSVRLRPAQSPALSPDQTNPQHCTGPPPPRRRVRGGIPSPPAWAAALGVLAARGAATVTCCDGLWLSQLTVPPVGGRRPQAITVAGPWNHRWSSPRSACPRSMTSAGVTGHGLGDGARSGMTPMPFGDAHQGVNQG